MSSVFDLKTLIPHQGKMVLIDDFIEGNPEYIRVGVTIRAGNVFMVPGFGVPGWVGFEMMAQTVSAYDGLLRRGRGESPKIGFLLGCRQYSCAREWFTVGESLEISATPVFVESESMIFDCRIKAPGGTEIATAQVTVFQPDDPVAFLQQAR